MYTYIMHVNSEVVKIGRSENPTQRMAGFQTINPFPMKLLLQLEGDWEKELKEKFKKEHIRNELFRLSENIEFFIDNPIRPEPYEKPKMRTYHFYGENGFHQTIRFDKESEFCRFLARNDYTFIR